MFLRWMYNHILLLMSRISPSIHHQISPIKADAFDLVHTINLPKTINKSEAEDSSPSTIHKNQKSIEIKVSKDKMEVFISLVLPQNCSPFSKTEITSVLENLNITCGIDEDKIQGLCNDIIKIINHSSIKQYSWEKPNDWKDAKLNIFSNGT